MAAVDAFSGTSPYRRAWAACAAGEIREAWRSMQVRDLRKLAFLSIEFQRIARFGIVGAVVTLVYAVATFLLVEFIGLATVSASIIGQLTSTALSYLGHSCFSFGVATDHRNYLWRFLVVAALTFSLNALVTYLLTIVMGVNYRISIVLIAIVIPLTNYICNRFWVFRSGLDLLPRPPSDGPGMP